MRKQNKNKTVILEHIIKLALRYLKETNRDMSYFKYLNSYFKSIKINQMPIYSIKEWANLCNTVLLYKDNNNIEYYQPTYRLDLFIIFFNAYVTFNQNVISKTEYKHINSDDIDRYVESYLTVNQIFEETIL